MTSLIVPVYNGAHVLARTVPAILALDGVDEWIWVDDGSTDSTARQIEELIQLEPRARLVRQLENRGRAAARNRGVSEATGDTLVFFDADVVPEPDVATALVRALSGSGAVASIATVRPLELDLRDPYHVYLSRFRRGAGEASPGERISWRFFLTGSCAITAEALRSVGGFDDGIEYGEDVALAIRLAERWPVGLVASGANIGLLDLGSLETALAKVGEFGEGLAVIAQDAEHIYRTLQLETLTSPKTWKARIAASTTLASVVRRALPALPRIGTAWAVRYLLGHHLMVSHARAIASKQR